MSKTFDTLFNEFINSDESDSPSKRSEIKKVIETIVNFKKLDKGEISIFEIDAQLGEPTTTESFIKDGMMFTRLVWQTPQGEFVKLVATDVLPDEQDLPTIELLEEKLAEAVAEEDYPRAIALRDEIRKRSEKK